ncbi:MAG TPA: hypothetical protein VMX12_07600 [Acidimicrobiia bacterium]|nr:hypothetical protein [Acidimicrobiia bacterium]
MSTILAADALTWAVAIAVVSVVALVLIIVAPWRTVRREPPLADEIEARLLLGEDPDAIDRDLAARDRPPAPVTDLHSSPDPDRGPDSDAGSD